MAASRGFKKTLFFVGAASIIICGIIFADLVFKKNLPNIIIVTLSGVRNCDSIEDPTHQYIPNLWNKMLKEGVLYANLTDTNYEFHMPIIHMINTGLYYPFVASIREPSFFQYIRKKYKLPLTKLWLIDSWFFEKDGYLETETFGKDTYFGFFSMATFKILPEVANILNGQELFFMERYRELLGAKFSKWPHWEATGKVTFKIFQKIMRRYKPKVVHYIMNNVEAAHYDTYGKYVLTLQESDKMIFEIWEMIRKSGFYKDNTYFIVTPDHSRNPYYMDHTINAPGNPSHTWLYIFGPGIKKGDIIDRQVTHADIFATVAYLMDIDTHRNLGHVLGDAFRNNKN